MNDEWSYYFNLSGQCYPIKPIATIRDRLTYLWPKNLVGIGSFSDVKRRDPNDPHLKRRVIFEFAGRIRHTGLRWPAHPQIDWKGSSWHTLSRPFCEWIINSGVLDTLPFPIKYTFASDELLFQMLLMESPFRDDLAKNEGREVIWPGPKTLTLEDWPVLKESSALFARKFDCHKDEKIMRRLSETNSLNLPKI
jgi:Core-2/I-Branching enzyme